MRSRWRRASWSPAVLLLTVGVVFTGCSGTGSGPSEKQVRDDWDGYVRFLNERYAGCPDVKITDVKIAGTSVEGSSAEVFLQISGEWISKSDEAYMGGACWKFSRSRGAKQTVERRLTYKKFDTGWRLDRTDDPMAKYPR